MVEHFTLQTTYTHHRCNERRILYYHIVITYLTHLFLYFGFVLTFHSRFLIGFMMEKLGQSLNDDMLSKFSDKLPTTGRIDVCEKYSGKKT